MEQSARLVVEPKSGAILGHLLFSEAPTNQSALNMEAGQG
jgi:hypothetical protein